MRMFATINGMTIRGGGLGDEWGGFCGVYFFPPPSFIMVFAPPARDR